MTFVARRMSATRRHGRTPSYSVTRSQYFVVIHLTTVCPLVVVACRSGMLDAAPLRLPGWSWVCARWVGGPAVVGGGTRFMSRPGTSLVAHHEREVFCTSFMHGRSPSEVQRCWHPLQRSYLSFVREEDVEGSRWGGGWRSPIDACSDCLAKESFRLNSSRVESTESRLIDRPLPRDATRNKHIRYSLVRSWFPVIIMVVGLLVCRPISR